MRVALFVNPRSGRGRADATASEIESSLRHTGYEVVRVDLGAESEARLRAVLRQGATVLCVTGGDGTVHHAAHAASEHDVPVYHIPMGTENLFAREFGMTRSMPTLKRALERMETTRVDMGECEDHTFLVMASMGPDASVVRSLAASRNGAISHMTYVPHIAREALRPRLLPMRVHADGELIVDGKVGQIVVATMRQYAARINPCPDADRADSLLDVVFFPARTTLGIVSHLARCRLRLGDHRNTIRANAKRVRIEVLADGAPLQLDGEGVAVQSNPLEIRIRPACLPVLMP
ncbi:MAG: diacylglycerol/lipid kinase family protein [Phycisphaerales bacterium JB043]